MRILLALDDSAKASAFALELAKKCNAELAVLFVLDATWNVYVGHDWLSGSNSRADFLDWIKEEESKAADSALAAFGALAGDIPYTTLLAAGDVQRQILDETRKGYDLLIMGNPFRRGLEVMRNTCAVAAQSCPCSVLLVK
jgi:nucleotide-binding universal stress UspA family protein